MIYMFSFEQEIDGKNSIVARLDSISSRNGIIGSEELEELADDMRMSFESLKDKAIDLGYKVESL